MKDSHATLRDPPGEIIPRMSLRASMKDSKYKKDMVAMELKRNYVKGKQHSHRCSFLNLSLPQITHYILAAEASI